MTVINTQIEFLEKGMDSGRRAYLIFINGHLHHGI